MLSLVYCIFFNFFLGKDPALLVAALTEMHLCVWGLVF